MQPMKLQILSDLHLEFAPFQPPITDADVVILAGDIHVRDKGLHWALEALANRPVLYVLGNHEYYKSSYPRLVHKLEALSEGTRITVLENRSLEINDVAFFGCTLWTDFELFGEPHIAGWECQQKMNDFRRIRLAPAFSRFSPRDAAAIHRHSRQWLRERVAASGCSRKVVISHHGPSRRSLTGAMADDLLSAAYVSDLEGLIGELDIDLWIHGHLHHRSDYRIGRCRVLANPRGYPDEPNPEFDPGLVVTI
jgi:predicted phosphodiesterase